MQKCHKNLSAYCNGVIVDRHLLGQSLVISEITSFYWLLYTLLLSDRWCRYELIGFRKKWCDLRSETGLWRRWCLRTTSSAGLSRAEMERFTLLQLTQEPFHLVANLWCNEALKERATTNEIWREPEKKQGGEHYVLLLPLEPHASLISWCCLPQL